jgi:hypothetical protein
VLQVEFNEGKGSPPFELHSKENGQPGAADVDSTDGKPPSWLHYRKDSHMESSNEAKRPRFA